MVQMSFVSGDTLEFDVCLQMADGQQYQLVDGDNLWFNIKKTPSGDCLVAKEQESKHFKLSPSQTELPPGQYCGTLGIVFSSGDIFTLLPDIQIGVLPRGRCV